MLDLYYKASTEADLYDAIPMIMKKEDSNGDVFLECYSNEWSWDWDVSYEITKAIVDEATGDIITPAVMSNSFHANLRLINESIDVSSIDVFKVDPLTPDREWA